VKTHYVNEMLFSHHIKFKTKETVVQKNQSQFVWMGLHINHIGKGKLSALIYFSNDNLLKD
jgi:hypothetical protein